MTFDARFVAAAIASRRLRGDFEGGGGGRRRQTAASALQVDFDRPGAPRCINFLPTLNLIFIFDLRVTT